MNVDHCEHCGQEIEEVLGGLLVHTYPDDPDRPDVCWDDSPDYSAAYRCTDCSPYRRRRS